MADVKMTDERVAEALGWSLMTTVEYRTLKGLDVQPYHSKQRNQWVSAKGEYVGAELPAFTTSLDAIVAEIEARGLDWWDGIDADSKPARKFYAQVESPLVSGPRAHAVAATAPLALCAALLAWMKENKR